MSNVVLMPRSISERMYAILLDDETPFACRRSIDKYCYEVVMQTNEDWREVVSTTTRVSSHANYDEANRNYKRLCAKFKYDLLVEAVGK